MKKCIGLFLFIWISATALAQAPQGINYQAVAYNTSGAPIVNAPVSVRLTILDGSATGTVVYQETHQPTTDNTGMFALVIGNGTVVAGSFSAIPWATGNKWLQTEMDITGGSSYTIVSSSQFMSTPYALYANQAGGASANNRSSFQVPDGLVRPEMVVLPMNGTYTVPASKNLYINCAIGGVKIDGRLFVVGAWSAGESRTMIGASENSVISDNPKNLTGFLVDKQVQWQTFNLLQENLTVPANKVFVVVNSNLALIGGSGTSTCALVVNGQNYLIQETLLTNAVLAPGTVLSTTNCSIATPTTEWATLNGYFLDY